MIRTWVRELNWVVFLCPLLVVCRRTLTPLIPVLDAGIGPPTSLGNCRGSLPVIPFRIENRSSSAS